MLSLSRAHARAQARMPGRVSCIEYSKGIYAASTRLQSFQRREGSTAISTAGRRGWYAVARAYCIARKKFGEGGGKNRGAVLSIYIIIQSFFRLEFLLCVRFGGVMYIPHAVTVRPSCVLNGRLELLYTRRDYQRRGSSSSKVPILHPSIEILPKVPRKVPISKCEPGSSKVPH